MFGEKSFLQKNSLNELTSFKEKLYFTSANISKSDVSILAGSIFGGKTNYYVVAFINVSLPIIFQLRFSRAVEIVYITLSQSRPIFEGNISFSACCTNVLQNLYVNIYYENNVSLENQQGIIYSMFYAIYSNPIGGTNIGNTSSIEKNALGLPYPTHAYTLSLLILLIGQIPVVFIDYFLEKFKRKKLKKLS